MRSIFLTGMMAFVVGASACAGGGGGGTEAVTKIRETYGRRAQITDGWLTVMEQNATDAAAGLQKGAEYIATNVPILIQMATDLCAVIRANQRNAMVRDAFQKVNEEVKTGMETWKTRAGAVNEKYQGHAQVLNEQFVGLNSAFFETAKSCMPE